MSSYDISPRAEADMDEIWTFLALRNRPAADRMIRSLVAKYEMLSRQPLVGETAGHLHPGLRRIVHGNYVVYYEVDSTRVTIRRIIHGARDLKQFFGPQD